MTRITVNADCANSPEKLLLRDLNIAFARADVEAILAFMTDDISWKMVGEDVAVGKPAVREALEAMKAVATRELVIHSIIIDGSEGAVNGVITTEAGRSYAFCDIVRFSSASALQIESLTSYAIDQTKEQ